MDRNKSLYSRTLIAVACILILQACVTSRTEAPHIEEEDQKIVSEAVQKSQKAFADRNPEIISNLEGLEWKVRMAGPAEIPAEDYKIILYGVGEGAGSLALGFVAPPMYASALVVGGVFLIPLGTYIYSHDKKVWDAINRALSEFELTHAVDKALKERLNSIFTGGTPPSVNFEIIIQTFGIISSTSFQRNCFVVAAEYVISSDEGELKKESLRITDKERSADSPPPQCARLERFAEDDARLVWETMAEYAEVLAAMAIDRIQKGDRE